VIGRILAVTQRELKSYFVSPVAYVVIALFLVVCGLLFGLIVLSTREASLRYLLSNISVVFLFLVPAMTMRLLAEEQGSGTMELLLTNPIRDGEIVVGKYLAAVALLIVMLVLTLYYPAIMFGVGGNPDRGPLAAGYLGILLIGAAMLSIGLFASSLTRNQIIAGVLTFAILLVLWMSGSLAGNLGGPVGDAAGYLSINDHFQEFPRGVIDTKDVLYFVSIILAGLFLTYLSIQSRRWR